MEFKIKSGDLAKQKTPCLILGVFEKRKLSVPARAVDDASGGYLSEVLRKGDLDGETGHTLMLHGVPGVRCERILLVGCGKRRELSRRSYRKALEAAVTLLDNTRATAAVCTLPELAPEGLDLYRSVRDTVTTCVDKVYRYDRTKGEKKPPRYPLVRLDIWVSSKGDNNTAQQAIRHGRAIGRGMSLAKDLGNLPGNLCTPSYLADSAMELGSDYASLRVEVLEEADMEKLGMGALLSVARGSRQPAKLILMEYRGGNEGAKPVVLVGKGLTFDAGGISIKPAADMNEMKFDMCGAASVFGAMKAALELELPINLIGVVPASENLPDGNANKPGDIVTSMSGQTSVGVADGQHRLYREEVMVRLGLAKGSVSSTPFFRYHLPCTYRLRRHRGSSWHST